tara:strand:+ start:95 stop:595 length:501 start_codon:yes stop_codon:yes gene_type:complete
MTKSRPLPKLEIVKEKLNYNPETGVFTWKVRPTNGGIVEPGDVAGTVHKQGYRRIGINKVYYAAHRLAWLLVHKEDPGEMTVDHKNKQKDDNRISNLRLLTQAKQNTNKPIQKGFSVTGTKENPRYQARIKTNGVSRNLGCFGTPEEASAAYRKAKIEEHECFVVC